MTTSLLTNNHSAARRGDARRATVKVQALIDNQFDTPSCIVGAQVRMYYKGQLMARITYHYFRAAVTVNFDPLFLELVRSRPPVSRALNFGMLEAVAEALKLPPENFSCSESYARKIARIFNRLVRAQFGAN